VPPPLGRVSSASNPHLLIPPRATGQATRAAGALAEHHDDDDDDDDDDEDEDDGVEAGGEETDKWMPRFSG
jgi:hypothetical protein